MPRKGHRAHSIHVPFEYSQITNHVYLGRNPCCQEHFSGSLLAEVVAADISLEEERAEAPLGLDYYVWLPVTDSKPPTQMQLLIGARNIKNFVDSDIKVYVHCRRGHGRSPTLVAAYLILEGLTASSAIKMIRQHRMIHLKRTQMSALGDFQQRVRRDAIARWAGADFRY